MNDLDREEFTDYIRQAMEHLYDAAYLETHPLAHLAGGADAGEVRGRAVRRLLLDAVDALKPAPDAPEYSLSWRKYQYLYLRYVEALPVPEIARDLGISVRQSRRYCQEGLAAITQILLDTRRCARPARTGAAPTAAEDVPASGESAEVATSVEGVSVGDLLASVVCTFRPLAERRAITVRSLALDRPRMIAVDRTTVRQALLCLLEVALGLGSTLVELSVAEPAADDRIAVRLRAALPVPTGALERQASADEHWLTARQLVECAGARLRLEPTGERELTFVLGLPAVQAATVLVIEDSPDAVQLYRRFVAGHPYRLICTAATRALSDADRERPAAIILDVMMPNQDGWEVLQTLKHQPETREIPVIVCSVLRERDLALALGAAEFLVKPVGRRVFLRTLDRLTTHYSAARPDLPEGIPSAARP